MDETKTIKVKTNEEGYFEAFIELKGPGITNVWCEAKSADGEPQAGWAKRPSSDPSCTNQSCSGVGDVVAGNSATITVSDTNTVWDDDVNLFVNGSNLGVVAGADPAVPTTFNGVTINVGSNIIRIEYVTGPVNFTSKQITVVSGGQTATFGAAIATDYTICGVCP